MANQNNAITITDLTVRYGPVHALRKVNLLAPSAQHVAIIGPSGSGKTTLLRCVAGLHRPNSGQITCGDDRWNDNNTCVRPELRRIGMIAQNPGLWPHMTARQHLRLVLKCRGVPRQQREAEAQQMLQRVAIAHRADHKPSQLSGGEAQRLALARALIGGSRLLLLDEPLSQLDILLRRELAAVIHQAASQMQATVLHVTHDPVDALQWAHQIAIVEDGSLTQQGTPAQLRKNPATEFVRQVVNQ